MTMMSFILKPYVFFSDGSKKLTLTLGLCFGLLVGCESHKEGEQLYVKNCKACHAQGINGAPILGNQKMWAKRVEQDKAVLVEHAVNGYGLMPAKGGASHLSDEQIEAVVGYMLSQLK